MTPNAHTNLWGGLFAAGVASLTYWHTGGNFHDPLFWTGMILAAAKAAEAYWSNKAPSA